MREVDLLVALGAGLLSFLSPCVLPLIPGYLSFISGYALSDLRAGGSKTRILLRTLAFVAGFTVVFVAVGILFAGGGSLIGGGSPRLGAQAGIPPARVFSIVAGIVVSLLGLNFIFDFAKFLSLEARLHPDKAPRGLAGAVLVGMAFAAGWSPCIGPILASILLFAAREGDLPRSLALLGSYSLGLALPFIAAGLFFDRVKPLLDWFRKRAREVRIVSGVLLVALGLAMILGRISIVNSLAARGGFALKEFAAASPEPARLLFAGLWLLLALLPAVLALLRRKPFPKASRVAVMSIFVVLAILEFTGLLSTPSLVSGWLLFQGA